MIVQLIIKENLFPIPSETKRRCLPSSSSSTNTSGTETKSIHHSATSQGFPTVPRKQHIPTTAPGPDFPVSFKK